MTEEISPPYAVAEVAEPTTCSELPVAPKVELNFSLTLPDAMYRELIEGCRDCNCSPKQFAAESLETVLASRRLPRVGLGRHGARIGGTVARELENV